MHFRRIRHQNAKCEKHTEVDISFVLVEIIKKIKGRGISIIISEHRLDLFKEVTDRFLYVDKGKLNKIWTRQEFENLSDEKLSSLGLRPKTVGKNSNIHIKTDKDLLLDIHSLSFHYKKTREGINNINLQLYKGEVVLLDLPAPLRPMTPTRSPSLKLREDGASFDGGETGGLCDGGWACGGDDEPVSGPRNM